MSGRVAPRELAARRIRRFPGEANAPRLYETGMQWVLKHRAALWSALAGCCGADVFSFKPNVHGETVVGLGGLGTCLVV